METVLIQGDASKILQDFVPQSKVFDVVVTSPPYNLGVKYGKTASGKTDRMRDADYLEWVSQWSEGLLHGVDYWGSVFVNMGSNLKDPTKPMRVLEVLQRWWKVQNIIIWVKSVAIPAGAGETTLGHFKPINSDRYLNDTFEYIFHLSLRGDASLDRKAPGVGTTYADESNLKRWKSVEGINRRCRGNVWFMPYDTIQSRDRQRPHPATFPVELAARCIRLCGDPKSLRVLDPFTGLSSTGVAAQRLGCARFCGIDIDQDYIEFSRARLEEEASTAQK